MAFLYTCFVHLALPFALLRLWWRARREPGYTQLVAERLGRYTAWQDERPVLWLHAVSLGETRAAAPLIDALLQAYPSHRLLLTHMTPTGRQAGQTLFAAHLASGRMRQAWLPYDLPWAVRAFVQHFKPQLGLLMETEVWPNLVKGAAAQGVALCLVNGRMSARSAARYAKVNAARAIFASFTQVLAQSTADAERFTSLGAKNVSVTGNIKFDVTLNPQHLQVGQALHHALQPRGIWCAANTREGEESLVLQAWQTVQANVRAAGLPSPLLILVPRHPQRFDAVWAQIQTHLQVNGGQAVRRSQASSTLLDSTTWLEQLKTADICLGDSLGEMPLYYTAADFAFIGGSLLPLGGHNLIEACACGLPVLMGPHMFNFAQASQDALLLGAGCTVADAQQLAQCVTHWLLHRDALAVNAQAAHTFTQQYVGATQRTIQALQSAITSV